jgi:hypothetical protein
MRIEVSADSSGDDPGRRVVVDLISSSDESGNYSGDNPGNNSGDDSGNNYSDDSETMRQVLKPSRMICPCLHLH